MNTQARHTPWTVLEDAAECGYFYVTDNPASLARCNPPCTQIAGGFRTRDDAEAFVEDRRAALAKATQA